MPRTLTLLDQFTADDIRVWKAKSEALERYWIRIHYHLDGLRQLHQQQIHDALHAVKTHFKELKNWVRIVDYAYSQEPLSARGSTIRGGRFNIGSDLNSGIYSAFPTLYCAENYTTAYFEKFGSRPAGATDLSGEQFALRDPTSFASVRLNGQIRNIFDLRKTSSLKPFVDVVKRFQVPSDIKALAADINMTGPILITKPSDLKSALLDGNWREWPVQFDIPANSQIFGRLIYLAGFEGILYDSTKGGNLCLAIFPQNMVKSESFVELNDPSPASVKFRRLDSGTISDLI